MEHCADELLNLGIKAKVENKGQYEQYLEELKPLREELGVNLKEELFPEQKQSIRMIDCIMGGMELLKDIHAEGDDRCGVVGDFEALCCGGFLFVQLY